MCVDEHDFILLDGEDLRLRMIEGFLLPRDRNYLNYTSDFSDDMSRKMC